MKYLLKAVLYGLDEAILVAVAFIVLWKIGVHLTPLIIATVIVILGALTFIRYKVIVSIARSRHTGGPEGMIGLQGRVVRPLTPEGLIKIRGEFWKAACTDDSIKTEEEIIVVGIDRLKLLVKRKNDV